MKHKNIKKQKRIPTLIGVMIVIATSFVLFGGAFIYQRYLISEQNTKIIFPQKPISISQVASPSSVASTQQSITITSPNQNDVLNAGQKYTIGWRANGFGPDDKLYLLIQADKGAAWESITQVPASADQYVWNVPGIYKDWYIWDASSGAYKDWSGGGENVQICLGVQPYPPSESSASSVSACSSEFSIITQYMTVTIMVPENIDTYKNAISNYLYGSNPPASNPAEDWPFAKKEVSIPVSDNIIRASAEAAADELATYGNPNTRNHIIYLKIQNGIAYVFLDIDIDGWAGVSGTIGIIDPLVEKTLLQFPQIKNVKFRAVAPGDNMQDVYNGYSGS